ncbi:UNVERIFIED_CONTAM: hypothetical protein PYX00_007242 [Menopon gallinae]|uniref:VWFA domain-containing protein n=1 Tax=Menopon gallinae TaxID=328185 RepID=A0AAW2HJ34_9NEOP
MGRALLCAAYLICAIVFARGDVLDGFVNGNRSELAVVIDMSDGNIAKVKEFWKRRNVSREGKIFFGAIDGLDYETAVDLEDLREVAERVEDLRLKQRSYASSSGLLRYLLKTMSTMAKESDLVLFTGRTVEEEPLHKAVLDKSSEKHIRVSVVWTGNTTEGIEALRVITESSKGTFDVIANQVSGEKKLDSEEVVLQPRLLSKMVEPEGEFQRRMGEITSEGEDKTLKKMERVRFPEKKSPEEMLVEGMSDLSKSIQRQQQSTVEQFVPMIVEVSSISSLIQTPGSGKKIYYDVKNNMPLSMPLRFVIGPTENIRVLKIQPATQVLQPLESVRVEVSFESAPEISDNAEGMLSFSATNTYFSSLTTRRTIIYFTKTEVRDNWDPKVTYKYVGDCKDHDRPDTCEGQTWKFEATFQDETSGLKKVLSEPYGLIFNTRFDAGTKAPVSVYYTASCCKPKIDIWAEDSQGNFVRRSLDAYNQGLLAAEIAAVVLGVLLLICIIIGIVAAIIIMRRRKQNKLIIPRYQGGN